MTTVISVEKSENLKLHLTVLGRVLEHLGTQMYKRRDVAIAELVANAWDAGAKRVSVIVPEENYDAATDHMEVLDDGCGMSSDTVQTDFLVIGRNRRKTSSTFHSRPVMGKKGIGKLAGFGMATLMEITTWKDGQATEFKLDLNKLKLEDDQARDLPVEGQKVAIPGWAKTVSGTRIILRNLKHASPMDVLKLRESLSRRFSTRIRGEMEISVNGIALGEPHLELEKRFPDEGQLIETLPNGNEIRYHYGFTKLPIGSSELRGFTIYVRGRTAQAPPFFFDVEGTASGQHSTKYVTGAIEADFLDSNVDDSTDVISTDRQHIDWELPAVLELKQWGEALSRRLLRECAELKGGKMRDWICEDASIAPRLAKLEKSSRDQISKFLVILGQAEPEEERALQLADSLVQAFEYRHFHDVVSAIETASEDPQALEQLLSQIRDWKILESRAILEIVRGRIGIIDRFHKMVVNNAPETKSILSSDSLHDLLAGYPWLLNPEWQVLVEERTISKQLQEWGSGDVTDEEKRLRFDFLALNDEKRLVIVEIKRAGHPVELDELDRLQRYKQLLSKGTDKKILMVLVYGGTIDVDQDIQQSWKNRTDALLITWAELHSKNKVYYEHYRAVLERDLDNPSFGSKEVEVAKTRKILEGDTVHRDDKARKAGLGGQDIDAAIAAEKDNV
jgi:hypothetical protein